MIKIVCESGTTGLKSLDIQISKALDSIKIEIQNRLLPLEEVLKEENGLITVKYLTGEKNIITVYGLSPENDSKVKKILLTIDFVKLLDDLHKSGLN